MNGNLVYICIHCGHVQDEEHEFIPPHKRIEANILYIDLETSKSMYYNYGQRVRSGYLQIDNLVHEWFMLGWAASYIGNERVWSQIVTPEAAVKWDDSGIVQRLWDLMNATEIIAGHNVDGFDIKRCNTRFARHGLAPILGKKTIDTLKLARSKMAWESKSLGYISQWYGFDGKDNITNQDWIDAMNGNEKTLERIHKYNRGDVVHGKQVLQELLPIANKKFNFGAIRKETNEGELV